MNRLLAAALTVAAGAVLALGASLGVVALLNATPDQPNVPLVTYETASTGSAEECPPFRPAALPRTVPCGPSARPGAMCPGSR